jgi:hypothetical protein
MNLYLRTKYFLWAKIQRAERITRKGGFLAAVLKVVKVYVALSTSLQLYKIFSHLFSASNHLLYMSHSIPKKNEFDEYNRLIKEQNIGINF